MSSLRIIVLALTSTLFLWPSFALSQASSEAAEVVAPDSQAKTYDFTKKRYSINGQAQVLRSSDTTEITFNDAFKTRGGPDLKVYLSKKSLDELDGELVNNHSVKIGVLKSKKGLQSYVLPAGISLSDYKSVIIHCEAFEVLWGGFDL